MEEENPEIQKINIILKQLINDVEGIYNVALVAREGFPVAAILEKEIEPMKIGALSAIILNACERVLLELNQGELDVCIIRGLSGNFVVMECGQNHILASVISEEGRLDQIFIKMRSTAENILDVLGED
ncbi:MAG: roadblock/LC7 domain-containing protein [Promethearchaeota archaeon]